MLTANFFNIIINDYTIRTVLIGTSVIGFVSGSLGVFSVLRKQSLLGDVISHAALPGIAAAFLISGYKSQIWLTIGAIVSAVIATLIFISVSKSSKLKTDSALGVILSLFFGFGIVLLTVIQRQPNASQAGIDKFIFGQAAGLVTKDLVIIISFAVFAMLITIIFWKEIKIHTFDASYTKTLGFNINIIEAIISFVIIVAIVIGLQSVGVILMSSLLIAPAVASRQWTEKLGTLFILSAIIGSISGASGAILSSFIPKLPTGPVIVISSTVIALISILFAPKRGIIPSFFRNMKAKEKIDIKAVLLNLYELSLQHENSIKHKHSYNTIKLMQGASLTGIRNTLNYLLIKGYAEKDDFDNWTLTIKGYNKAKETAVKDNKL